MEIQKKEFEKLESISESYYELIMAVENKYPGENRHQTALRLIKKDQSPYSHSDQADLNTKAAIFLEENSISGDTMVQCDVSEHKGWIDLHDIMADFVRERIEMMQTDLKIELLPDNEIEAFAGYVNYEGGFTKDECPQILINFRSMLITAAEEDMNAKEYKAWFAENVVHEMLHMIQAIFKQAFDEEEVDDAILQARETLKTEGQENY